MRNDKILAYKMRMQGRSYTEISKSLGMSKSTLSAWFRHLSLPKDIKEKIQNKARASSLNTLFKINKEQTHLAEQRVVVARSKAQKNITKLTKRELMLVGVSLYWSEGYKKPIFRNGRARTYHPISFTNSDPNMVKIFLRFLRETCGVHEEKIVADLRVFDNQNEAHTIDYWSKVTKIPFSNFRKVYKNRKISGQDKSHYNILPYGTIQIRVNDTPLFHTIMGWIEGLQNS